MWEAFFSRSAATVSAVRQAVDVVVWSSTELSGAQDYARLLFCRMARRAVLSTVATAVWWSCRAHTLCVNRRSVRVRPRSNRSQIDVRFT